MEDKIGLMQVQPTVTRVTPVEVFVSSPSDVVLEREALIRAVERINRLPQIREKYVIRPFRYEEIAPVVGDSPQIIVDRACHVSECYLVICILWNRMGTPFVHPSSKKRFRSGTEYEFLTAYEASLASESGFPVILLYKKESGSEESRPKWRRLISTDECDSDQRRLVSDFFGEYENQLSPPRGLYSCFTETSAFEDEVFFHILEQITKVPPNPTPEIHLAKIVEEDRRLDLAAPGSAPIDNTVELWAKICLSDSEGLKSELPEQSHSPGAPSQADATEKFMAVAFERDEETSEILPLRTEIEIVTQDFDVAENTRHIELKMGRDSPTIVFLLHPREARNDCVVLVRVKTKSIHGDYWIENCSMVCRISIYQGEMIKSVYHVDSSAVSRLPLQRKAEKIGLMQEQSTLTIDEKPKAIKFEMPVNDFDPTKELNNIVKDFKNTKHDDGGLSKEIIDFGGIIQEEGLELIGKEEKLLNEAKLNIKNQKYGKAREILSELISLNPDHQEGMYLLAYCLVHMKKELEAVEFLKYFTYEANSPNKDLQVLITSLVIKMRSRIFEQIMLLFLKGRTSGVQDKLDVLISLDEANFAYYYMQALIYSNQDLLFEALNYIEKGLKRLPGSPKLIGLRANLEKRLLDKELYKALTLYKKNGYKLTLASIQRLDPVVQNTHLCKLFYNYVYKLDRESALFRKKSPVEVPMDGMIQNKRLLQQFIVKAELDQATALIGKNQHSQALPFIDKALTYVPRYPFLHFLKALCVYQQYLIDFLSLKLAGKMEQAIEDLKSIKQDAQIALEDKTIREARHLKSEVGLMLKLIEAAYYQNEVKKKEVEIVNSLIKAFEKIMEEGKGIKDIAHLKTIRTELQRIHKQANAKLKIVKSDNGTKYLNQLIDTCQRNLDELKKIETQIKEQQADEKFLSIQSSKLESFVEDLNSGKVKITSYRDCDRFIDKIDSYISDIKNNQMYRVKSDVSKQVLSQIVRNWQSIRQQFVDVKNR